jgi:non-heme chloroperoxidase
LSHKIKGVNGVSINIEDVGTGRPIVFIHGWPVNHEMFEYQFTELPKHGYRCIGIDLRGFGDSDKPWNGYSYDTMADDLRAVLDNLNLQNVVLVGFSMRGAIAIHYMARHRQCSKTSAKYSLQILKS